MLLQVTIFQGEIPGPLYLYIFMHSCLVSRPENYNILYYKFLVVSRVCN